MGSQVSSVAMSVRAGQDSDELLVSQAVWDYLDAARRPWLLDFQSKQGLRVDVVRRGERGGCCAVRLRPVEGASAAGPVSPASRRAFIDLCRSARREMSKQQGAPKRKRSLLPCISASEADGPTGREAEVSVVSGEGEISSCSICMGEIVEKTTLDKCGHSFCRACLDRAFQVKRACPVCRLVYGQLIGNQPANGSMIVERDPDLELPGHEGYGCVCIIYSFPPGMQAPEHPNPGVRYPGTDRVAYLPDSPEGNRVLGLLRRAFEQRLIFTIGTSMTTGMQNVITWNDIHHKTSIWGGPRCFGYPDPTYLVRVTEELREKGITAD
ncbi:putative E3 ubiquitin-protein ligase DTX3 isoform X2 [Arapaima gigas]